jgi:hypothetical protein
MPDDRPDFTPLASLQRYAADPARTDYNTALPLMDEFTFRKWLAANNVPFDPNAAQSDYDMRGFYRGLMQGHPRATQGVNPNDQRMHYTDYWKTPYHQSFSGESQYAAPNAPQWINEHQLAAPSGRIVFDERKESKP